MTTTEKKRVNVSFPQTKHKRLMMRKVEEGRDQMDILGDAFEMYEATWGDADPRKAGALAEQLRDYALWLTLQTPDFKRITNAIASAVQEARSANRTETKKRKVV